MGDVFGEIVGSIYSFFFESFYGEILSEYLWGDASPEQVKNMYLSIGTSVIFISLVIALIFYYLINHPRWNTVWHWLLFLVINAVVNFIVGWQWVLRDKYAGLMYWINPVTGQEEDLLISEGDIALFGVANALLSFAVFFIWSLIVKWGSRNCSRSPF